MKIEEIVYQNRNDFFASMRCEHCNAIAYNRAGYDDNYYHEKVIPAMHCNVCKKNRAGDIVENAIAKAEGK